MLNKICMRHSRMSYVVNNSTIYSRRGEAVDSIGPRRCRIMRKVKPSADITREMSDINHDPNESGF